MENIEPLEQLYEILELLTAKYGVMGIAVAMFAESAGVPLASAVVILASGTMILRGSVSFWSVFLASTIGITAGSIFSYYLGMFGSMISDAVKKSYRHRNGSRRDMQDNEKAENVAARPPSKMALLWDRYGNFSIFMAQLWGVTRTFISFPAGAMHMNLSLFIIYTFLGGAIYSLLAIALSLLLTGTMSFALRLLRMLFDISPWILLLTIILLASLVFLICHIKKRRGPCRFFNGIRMKIWKGFQDKDEEKELKL
ncbi:MAG TPA: DedA family protein [Firmicutes bacterium]|nr:DedA family protein [Bacillota bacterium]